MLAGTHTTAIPVPLVASDPLLYPLSFAQRRLWFLDKLEPGKAVYNVSEALRLRGPLDRNALARSLNEIIRRHDTLRTTFGELDGNPVQVVAASVRVDIPLQVLRHSAQEQPERAAARWINARANQPFDLKKGPLIRASLLQMAPDEHIFLIGMHHIISEGGWSMSVLLRELNALYDADLLELPARLPELPIQYGDYSVWQRDWLQGEVRDQLLDYWKGHLKGAPAVLNLPSDRPRPSQQTYSGSKESHFFPAPLKNGLSDFSKAEGVTLFMTLLTAFTIVLSRYSQQEDLVVGVPMAGRGSPETHDLIGFFANTLPLRADLSGDPTFREMIQRVKQVSLGAYDHEDLPFEMTVEALKPERSLAYTPIFQVMFAYQNAPREELKLAGLEVSAFEIETCSAMFDLTLFLWERPEGLLASLEFSTDLFDRATVQGLLRHMEVLLAGAMASPETPISRLPLLDQSERKRIVIDWNSTEAEYRPDVPLQQLIEAQVRNSPEAVAVTCGRQTLTYRELNVRANQLAAHLRSFGAGPDKLVGVCLERSTDLVVALLAIVKTGGAYVPLDPNYPDDRLNLIAQDSGIDVLVAAPEIQTRLPDFQGRIVALDWDVLRGYESCDRTIEVTGDHLAYVLYTSGSTGKPKGVAIPRRALLNLLCSMREQLQFSAKDVLLGVTTISFDIAGLEIWMPLVTGARLVLAEGETVMDGRRLQSELELQGVTLLQATPATWKLLLESGWQGKRDLKAACGGEAMPQDLARRLFPLVERLWNLYGPTETTIWSTAYRVSKPDGPILIGRPIANTQIYILDQNMAPVPVGVSGELYIGGDGLARGYLHQEELTAQRFVPNPFRPGTSIYKTGDVARYGQDGNIECLGRNDHQIKLRGFRIEPEEIRAALTKHPSISDAVAVLDSSAGEGRIVAYIVAPGGQRPGIPELRDCVRRSLPEYMLPAVFVFLDALPLTPNGKVDRRALPPPDAVTAKVEFAEPRNGMESRLKAIWEQVLGVGPIGVNDDFFDLGGHSFTAAQLFRDINFCFNLDLPLATLFRAPTVRRLAQIISESESSQMSAPVVEIQPQGSQPPIYCVGALDGEIIVFRRLAQEFGLDQPLWGLQPFRLPGPPSTVEQLAAAYIDELEKKGTYRPFCLLGYSFGGLVAVEMARQLQRKGVAPPIVALIDTGYPAGCRAIEPWDQRIHRFRNVWDHATKGGGWPYLQERVKHGFARMAHRASSRVGVPLVGNPSDISKMQLLAAESYRIKSYKGRVHLFRAESQREFLTGGASLGWSGVLSGLAIEHVPGDHGSMNTGMNLKILARKLSECLRHPFNPPTGVDRAE
jgi:amino acid adenylation domain-containing protein